MSDYQFATFILSYQSKTLPLRQEISYIANGTN